MKILPSIQLPDNHNQFFFGDRHIGSALSSDKGWRKLLDVMNSEYDGIPAKHNYGRQGGDMMEAIMVDDRRAKAETLKEPFVTKQKKMAMADMEPIKDRLLNILQGNHELKLWRQGDYAEEIADELGVPYGTYTMKQSILDKRDNLMFKVYQTHGGKTITSSADDPLRKATNEKLILKRHLKRKAADCAVMVKHHTHKMIVAKPESELYLYDDGKQIKQGYTGWGQNEPYIHPDARWYGNAASFLKLFGKDISGYAEVFELDPTELGWLILRVRNRKIVDLVPYYIDI